MCGSSLPSGRDPYAIATEPFRKEIETATAESAREAEEEVEGSPEAPRKPSRRPPRHRSALRPVSGGVEITIRYIHAPRGSRRGARKAVSHGGRPARRSRSGEVGREAAGAIFLYIKSGAPTTSLHALGQTQQASNSEPTRRAPARRRTFLRVRRCAFRTADARIHRGRRGQGTRGRTRRDRPHVTPRAPPLTPRRCRAAKYTCRARPHRRRPATT